MSIDGIETNDLFRGKGVTSKALENVKTLSNETEIRINTLLSSSIRWKEIEELAELGEKFSIVLAFNPVCPLGRADFSLMMEPHKYFRWMYRLEGLRNRGIQVRKCFDLIGGRLMERENCPVRKGATIHIAADGKAYPCGFLVNRPECLIGSYRGESSRISWAKFRLDADYYILIARFALSFKRRMLGLPCSNPWLKWKVWGKGSLLYGQLPAIQRRLEDEP